MEKRRRERMREERERDSERREEETRGGRSGEGREKYIDKFPLKCFAIRSFPLNCVVLFLDFLQYCIGLILNFLLLLQNALAIVLHLLLQPPVTYHTAVMVMSCDVT